jgi:hypothetical protein
LWVIRVVSGVSVFRVKRTFARLLNGTKIERRIDVAKVRLAVVVHVEIMNPHVVPNSRLELHGVANTSVAGKLLAPAFPG